MSSDQVLEQYRRLLSIPRSTDELYKAIVNTPFCDPVEAARLFLGIVVLLIVNPKTQIIHRVALSDTALAIATTRVSVKRFSDIEIPLAYKDNIIAEAINSGHVGHTSDWQFLFEPALTAEEARFNQAAAGIAFSAVYPFKSKKQNGALIFSYFQYSDQLGDKQNSFMDAYTAMVSEIFIA